VTSCLGNLLGSFRDAACQRRFKLVKGKTDLEDDEVVDRHSAGSDGLSERRQVAVDIVDRIFGSFAG
jgi:hypothetical protein